MNLNSYAPQAQQGKTPLERLLEMLGQDNSAQRERERTASLTKALPGVMGQAQQLQQMPKQEQNYWTSAAREPEYYDSQLPDSKLTLRQANPWGQKLNQQRDAYTESQKFAQQEGLPMAPPDIDPQDFFDPSTKLAKALKWGAKGLAGGVGPVAGMIRAGGKEFPNDFLFRATGAGEVARINAAKAAGLPYEVSTTAVNPRQQGIFSKRRGGDMGYMFDVPDETAIRTGHPEDIYAYYRRKGAGSEWRPETSTNPVTPIPGPNLDLEALYKQQGKQLAAHGPSPGLSDSFFNEVVADLTKTPISGVRIPYKPPLPGTKERETYDGLLAQARENQWKIFFPPQREYSKTPDMPQLLQEDPFGGTWQSGTGNWGLPVRVPNPWGE